MRRTRRPHDILIFKRHRAIAKKVILAAKQQSCRHYCTSMNNNTTLPMVWRTITKFSGSPTFTRIPQLEQNGIRANNNQHKANVLGNQFQAVSSSSDYPKPSQETSRPCMATFAQPPLRLGHATHESMLSSQWMNWKQPFLKPKILHQAMTNFGMKCLGTCPTLVHGCSPTILAPFHRHSNLQTWQTFQRPFLV